MDSLVVETEAVTDQSALDSQPFEESPKPPEEINLKADRQSFDARRGVFVAEGNVRAELRAGLDDGGGMDEDNQAQYGQFLLASRVNTRLVEFRDEDGRLCMVSIIDVLEQGLSSVYTFFDPELAGSLGTYGILWQIQQCRQLKLQWLYLGYWIEKSVKMAYKSKFKPAEYRFRGAWHQQPPPSTEAF